MPLCERDKEGGASCSKAFEAQGGAGAQAVGSGIKLFLILRGKVTISINYKGCSAG